ncbi:MAG: peptide chain release factor N(5)-glutamine methyltransferase [Edaphobacter sp.]
MTLRQALTAAAARLADNPHLRGNARRDAEVLLLDKLGISRAQLLASPEREMTEEEEFFFWQNVHRRVASEPVQYILGRQEFFGLDFHVSPAVLIPRPETEHLVEAVLQELAHDKPLEILDVGTGSGILAVTLAHHLSHAEITAIDISPEAIAVARRNAETHRVDDHIKFTVSDLLSAVDHKVERFDAIVSNPPYVAEDDRSSLSPEVRDYEPASALFAGKTGLDIYRRLIPEAHSALKPNGLLALEIGHGQRDAIAELLTGWREVSFLNDLQQIPRVALAHRPAGTATR